MELELHHINAGDYPIYIGPCMEQLQQFLADHYADHQKIILVDENTIEHCLPVLDWNGIEALGDAEVIQINSGENQKNIEVASSLWQSFLELNLTRKALLINLGGGVIGDMGGFVASTYKRGIDFIQIPTTLLSMVDSSVGGKVGIDLGCEKNMIGLFQNPKAVFIDPIFINTLPEREIVSGFGEIWKHALIQDKALWEMLIKQFTEESLEWNQLIYQSVLIKHDIVKQDFKESGLRKILNFGHTIGHAYESWCLQNEFDIKHGEAVAFGIIAETLFSKELPHETKNIIIENITKFFGRVVFPEPNTAEMLTLAQNDKKNTSENIECIQLHDIGKASFGHILSPIIFEIIVKQAWETVKNG